MYPVANKEDAFEAIKRWKIICEYLTDIIQLAYDNEDWEQAVDWMYDFPNKVENMIGFYKEDYEKVKKYEYIKMLNSKN